MLNWILFNVGDPTFKNYDNITYVVKYIFRKKAYIELLYSMIVKWMM